MKEPVTLLEEQTIALSAMLGLSECQASASPELVRHQIPNLLTPWSGEFPGSRTVKNKCVLPKPPSLWYVVTAARNE